MYNELKVLATPRQCRFLGSCASNILKVLSLSTHQIILDASVHVIVMRHCKAATRAAWWGNLFVASH